MLHVRTLTAEYAFARDLLLALRPGDFSKTVSLRPPHAGAYDEYGLHLRHEVRARHGVGPVAWYVKVRLYESFTDEVVFVVSLHPLEYDMARAGGRLRSNR